MKNSQIVKEKPIQITRLVSIPLYSFHLNFFYYYYFLLLFICLCFRSLIGKRKKNIGKWFKVLYKIVTKKKEKCLEKLLINNFQKKMKKFTILYNFLRISLYLIRFMFFTTIFLLLSLEKFVPTKQTSKKFTIYLNIWFCSSVVFFPFKLKRFSFFDQLYFSPLRFIWQ